MNGLKIVCVILIVLGLCACGFGVFGKTLDTGATTVADMPTYDMNTVGQGSISLDLTESEAPDGEITSTNGDVIDGETPADEIAEDANSIEAETVEGTINE